MARQDLPDGGAGNLAAGLDEVGRGPLAGPVVAAAVVLPSGSIEGVTDSKALSARRRAAVAERLCRESLTWAIGRAEAGEIDDLDIRRASLLAMERAFGALDHQPDYAWVDGRECPSLGCPSEAVVGGDARLACIGAASILAKQSRDSEMIACAVNHPGYGFDRHKGYPTQEHLAALDRLGPCELHRRSFAPVRRRLSTARSS